MLNHKLKHRPNETKNKVVRLNDGKTVSSTLREDIWGKDFSKYKKEIFELGITLMLFGGIVMLLSSPLSILGWSIPTIQGFSLISFTVGVIIVLKTFATSSSNHLRAVEERKV